MVNLEHIWIEGSKFPADDMAAPMARMGARSDQLI